MRRTATVAVLALTGVSLVACSPGGMPADTQAPPPAQADAPPPATPETLDPVGTYTFSTTYQGMTVTGKIVIRGEPDNYTGMIEPREGPPPVEIYAVTVEGRKITVYGDAGGDDLIMIMEFADGSSYTGSWMIGFEGADMAGEKEQ